MRHAFLVALIAASAAGMSACSGEQSKGEVGPARIALAITRDEAPSNPLEHAELTLLVLDGQGQVVVNRTTRGVRRGEVGASPQGVVYADREGLHSWGPSPTPGHVGGGHIR